MYFSQIFYGFRQLIISWEKLVESESAKPKNGSGSYISNFQEYNKTLW